jgi:hypothetical protein
MSANPLLPSANPNVANHAPQTKNCRNIITLSRWVTLLMAGSGQEREDSAGKMLAKS